jgi:hypothetical protein
MQAANAKVVDDSSIGPPMRLLSSVAPLLSTLVHRCCYFDHCTLQGPGLDPDYSSDDDDDLEAEYEHGIDSEDEEELEDGANDGSARSKRRAERMQKSMHVSGCCTVALSCLRNTVAVAVLALRR